MDELLEKAKREIKKYDKIGPSYLIRKLWVDRKTTDRIMDLLEKQGYLKSIKGSVLKKVIKK